MIRFAFAQAIAILLCIAVTTGIRTSVAEEVAVAQKASLYRVRMVNAGAR